MEPISSPSSSNVPPVANPGNDRIVYANETVHFNGSNSFDPDGNFLIYCWDFGDGSPLNYEESPIHTYETAGTYSVTLTVWDFQRSKDSDSCVIKVKPSFKIDLNEGWNLISFPSKQSSANINTVLKSIDGDYDIVQYYDTPDNNDYWKHYHIEKPSYMNDLHELNHKMGFWIHVTQLGGTSLNLGWDMLTEAQNIHLYSGWNLVGYPALNNRIRDHALNNLEWGKDVDSIWTFDANNQKWVDVGETDYFELGKGYWIHAKEDCDWLAFSPILNLNKNRYFSTIQNAIDGADPLDTIEISPGTYNEELTISKPITLLGKNNQTTIIKGNINPVIKIVANDVTINNLYLSSGKYGVIIQNSQNVQIKNNIINEFILSGIQATDSSVNIQNNQISNDPLRTGGYGIKLTKCNDVIVENNKVENIVYSLYLLYSSGLIQNNIISPTDGYDDKQDSIGIALYLNSNVTVIHNLITGADVGIGVEYESCSYIYENIITNSEYYGIFSSHGKSMIIINNTLSNSEVLLRDSSISTLELISGYVTLINSSISNYEVKNEAELTVKWYIDVRVVNHKGYPIFGVMIMVRNNLGHLLGGNFNTDIDGYVRDIVVTEFWQNDVGKVYYTPHNVTAVLGSHKEYANPEPWMNENKEVVIMVDHGGG
jgi:parallel beta-helix repeat protein